MKHNLFISILIPVLLISACNLPGGTPPDTEGLIFTQAAQTVTAAAGAQPTVTFTPIATIAVLSTATNTPVPCNQASFVSDVTIPDNTSITVNDGFTKTWKLKNVGSCTWTSGY